MPVFYTPFYADVRIFCDATKVYETQGSVDKNIGVLARNITFKNITGTVVGSGKGGGNGAVGGDPSFLVDAAGTFICDPARSV